MQKSLMHKPPHTSVFEPAQDLANVVETRADAHGRRLLDRAAIAVASIATLVLMAMAPFGA